MNAPSSSWQNFSTFLDQVGTESQPAQAGQLNTWGNYQVAPANVNPPMATPSFTPQAPGVPTVPTVPGYRPSQAMSLKGGERGQVQQGVLNRQDHSNPMSAIFAALGQGERHSARLRERLDRRSGNSGGFGKFKNNGPSSWNWN